MKKLFFSLCLVVLTGNSFSQSKNSLKVKITDIPPKIQSFELILNQYQGENFKEFAKITYTLHGNHEFTIPENTAIGLFSLNVDKEANKAEFIYNPSEKSFEIEAKYFELKSGDAGILNSPENEAYALLLKLKSHYEPLLEEAMMKRNALSGFEPDFKKRLSLAELQVEKLQYNLNDESNYIVKMYPQTFTARVLVPLTKIPVRSTSEQWKKEFDGYLSFLNAHYLDFVDFNNSEVLNHYAFNDKIVNYLGYFTQKTTDGAERGIDVIISNFKKNEDVNSFVYSTLLKSFLKLKSEALVQYLMKKEPNGCSLALSMQEMAKLESIKALSIGGNVPEISLPDLKGNYKSLKGYAQNNKLTLVFVWISWCARCQKEAPKLAELYKKYSGKGLGVYAVSLDEDRKLWEEAVLKHNANWLNVSELVSVNISQTILNYNISTTPALFIIDSKGTLLAKNLFDEKLETFIKEHLIRN